MGIKIKITIPTILLLIWAAPAHAVLGLRKISFRPDLLKEARESFDKGDYAQAADQISKLLNSGLVKSKELQEAYWYLGTSYDRTGRVDKALSTFQVAARLFPKNVKLIISLANLYQKVGLDEQAKARFEKVLKLDRKNAQAHASLAISYHRLGFFDSALDHYRRALDGEMKNSARMWRHFSRALAESGSYEEAQKAILKSIEISPEAENWVALAALQQKKGLCEKAFESLDKARNLAPENQMIPLQKSLWHLMENDTSGAGGIAEAVLQKDPSSPLARWITGVVKLRNGDIKGAIRDLTFSAENGSPFMRKVSAAIIKGIEK